MTDTVLLQSKIEQSGIKLKAIADMLGISRETLYNKIGNQTEFKVSELVELSRILNLTSEEKESIFFN